MNFTQFSVESSLLSLKFIGFRFFMIVFLEANKSLQLDVMFTTTGNASGVGHPHLGLLIKKVGLDDLEEFEEDSYT